MPNLTKEDKLSILKRLVKRIKNWRSQKSLPMIFLMGSPNFSESSPEFQQWLKDTNEGISVVFGRYSHWLAEFNDIRYSETMSVLLGDHNAREINFWKGLDAAQSLLESMIEDIEADRVAVIEGVPSKKPDSTGEDETASGSVRARQNVVHEIGLFQSRLGFNKAILLKQLGVEDFTNVDGLQYISFAEDRIEQAFPELIRALKREGLLL
jgi:predicted nucleotide-binding protein with TIR-like domain